MNPWFCLTHMAYHYSVEELAVCRQERAAQKPMTKEEVREMLEWVRTHDIKIETTDD